MRIITFLTIFLLASPLRAALPSVNSQFTRYLAQDGLSIGTVQAIVEDQDGFIWLGGFDGLSRFDGYTFEKIALSNGKDSLANAAVQDILVIDDLLWIATRGGLSRFNTVTNEVIHYQTGISNRDIIRQIARQGDVLWLATYGGLVKFSLSTNQLTPISALPFGILAITNGLDGDVWLGTNDRGLIRFNTNSSTITQFGHDPDRKNSLLHNVVWDVHFDPATGSVFAGTEAGLSELMADGTFVSYQSDHKNPTTLSAKEIVDVAMDGEGNIWLATTTGVSVLDRASRQFIRLTYREHDPRSLASSNTRKIFFDQNGDGWISSFPSGVNFLNAADRAFQTTRANSNGGLNYRSVLTLHEDPQGRLWIGTDGGGINVFENDRSIHSIRRLDGALDATQVAARSVLDIVTDPVDDTTKWIGAWGGGLNRLDTNSWLFQHYFYDAGAVNSLPGNNVWVIAFDADKSMWVGTTGGGLARYDRSKNQFIKFTERHGFDTPVIWDIQQTSTGLYFGTDGGLKKFNPQNQSFTSYVHIADDTRSLSSNTVFSIHEDNQGILWLGTRGGGLNRFDPATGLVTRFKEGLAHPNVSSIEEDDQGNLWLGTHGGLTRFNPIAKTFRSYDAKNGLQGNHFNINASLKLRTGELIFGGTEGFTRFHPDHVNDSSDHYGIFLRELRLANRPVIPQPRNDSAILTRVLHKTDRITLNHTHSVVTIEYAATSYRNASLMRYAYRLDGFDADWQNVGSQRSATYTNLDAGRYVFRVRASPDGHWGNDEASVIIDVLPAPWLTWWALMAYCLVAASLVYWAIDTQRRKKIFFRDQNALLEAKVAERTNELVQKEKLAALGSLVAGVSHELNTPIGNGLTVASAIAESAAAFEKIVASGLTKSQLDTFVAETREGSELIVSSLRRAADLVSSFKQVAVDRTSEQRRDFTLASVLYEIKMLMRNTLKNSPHTLEIYHNIDVRMNSYPGPLEQVLSNLINNALVHAFDGRDAGRIVIRTADIDEGRGVRIEVEDNGNGIDKAHIKHIFDPFFTTKLGSGGSGLGLHIVHNLLIGTLGGNIDVDSDIGRGTKFILRLPLNAPILAETGLPRASNSPATTPVNTPVKGT